MDDVLCQFAFLFTRAADLHVVLWFGSVDIDVNVIEHMCYSEAFS